MPRIDIRVHNLGMSGKVWSKTGTFEHPAQAAAFLLYWWQHLSCPERWELHIDNLEYRVVPPFPKEESEAHINYCLEFHRAFYEHGTPDRNLRGVDEALDARMEEAQA